MGARYAFSIDLDRCIGCNACVVACGSGNELPAGDAYIAVRDVVRPAPGGGLWGSFAHHRCFHCATAACVEVCPTGTLSKRDGLTAVDARRCSGCGYCTDACPFGVPRVRGTQVSKCIGCIDVVGDGRLPWCVRTCPTQAIAFGERDAILAEAQLRAEALKTRYPASQVYGEDQLGGLGLVMVLLHRPETYRLPVRMSPTPALVAWREAVRPASAGITAAAALTMGVMFVVARRRHLQERAEEEAAPPLPHREEP